MKLSLSSLLPTRSSKMSKEELNNSVLNVLPDGVIICDGAEGSHSIFYSNPAFCHFYDSNSTELIGQKLSQFFEPLISQVQFNQLVESLDQEKSVAVPLTIKGNDATRSVQLRIEPMFSNDGSLNYLVITQSDTTAIQQTKYALHESNQKLKELVSNQHQRINEHELQIGVIFEQAMDAMILLNESNQILDANDAALELFCHDRTSLLGLDIGSLLPDIKPTQIQVQLDQAPLYQEVSIPHTLFLHRHSDTLSLSGAIRYISIKHRKYVVITLRDKSSEHSAKMELKKNQSELEEVVRNLNLATQAGGIGIWSWDFESNEVTWDERMFEIYGVDPSLGANNYAMWQERVHPDDLEQSEHSLITARETLGQFNAEFRIQLPSGDIRWVKAAADVIFEQGTTHPIGMGGVNIDITKEKNAQASLRDESEAAYAASEAKSMFLANMSHEIRTPMNGVVGMLSLLSETELKPDQRTMISTIKDSALTLLHIINDILDFSKIEAGQMSLESVPVDLQSLLERTLDVLHLQASNKGIEMYLTYDPKLPKMIMSDSVRLSQIMLNLLGNAVKFTDSTEDEKGKIWVSASLGTDGIAPCINLMVEDNGIGMTEEQLKRLFKAFSQADTSTTRLYGGTGLGLSIIQSLLELMGGTISVESQFGVSSRFSLELPFIEVESPPEDLTPDFLSGSRVLLITNDQSVSTFCDINLSSYDCKVHIISSVRRAISVLNQAKQSNIDVDLIFLGPDLYNSYIYGGLPPVEREYLDQYQLLLFTKDVAEPKGVMSPTTYVMHCSPFKPSELCQAIGVLRGAISSELLHADTEEITLGKQQQKDGMILVVDDQATNRDVVQRQLSHLGYQCEMAIHGQEALQMWRTGKFDLILTDCHMPVMDGYELTKQVRKIEQQDKSKGHMPIIAITANAMLESSEQCMTSGMDDYLTKPVELATLNRSIEKWMKLSPSAVQATTPPPSPQPETASPICMNSLEKILGTSDRAIVAPLLEGYWESLTEDISLAEEALIQRNEANLQQIAHAAKGAARSAGAEDIATIFESIQNTATNKDWPFLTSALKQSRSEIERLKHYLIEHSIIENTEVSL
ncbi:response regulator [Vibrio ouci]|uniref:Sensory/regulatory protein RpfC n=1 Tax=Vibrio ouci TaxID=2499078 RepID=A0A4Y8WJZ0_9VIBR|nr:response regulator [Vibrio ouci]TFH92598.1 response regulator [Vibrio ouci]